MAKFKDNAFQVILPPPPKKQWPDLLTEAEVSAFDEVRSLNEFLDPYDYAPMINELQRALQTLVNWGQNPDQVGLEDCSIAVVTTKDDGQNPGYVPTGLAIVVQANETKRYQIYDFLPDEQNQSVVNNWNYLLGTARDIVGLFDGSTGNAV
jgi:hypothetical protein